MPTSLPPEFDANIYRQLHPDLRAAGFDDEGLTGHYIRHGRDEGRGCSDIRSRADFLKLIPAEASVLEICPGFSPALRRADVKYYDTDTRDALVDQASLLNQQTATIPSIDYVSPSDHMGVINNRFDVLLSVHNLSRHPNLITHLQQCERILAPGGRMFCIVADKRYSQDHFTPETSLAALLARYQNKDNSTHLEHSLAMGTTTHYNGRKHWAGQHGNGATHLEERVNAVLSGEAEVAPRHINSSYFTPGSFGEIIKNLRQLKLTALHVERLYPPVYGNNEFYVVLAAG